MEEKTNMVTGGAGAAQTAGNGPGLRLMNIQGLNGKTFLIPAYQRGFRWRWQQIRELIDDLYEFCTVKNDKIYCLQTITVIDKGNNVYEVVDGQQRLTAIWMLVAMFRCSPQYVFKAKAIKASLPIYSITYEDKESLNAYCNEIKKLLDEIENIQNFYAKKKISLIESKDVDSAFMKTGFDKMLRGIDDEDDNLLSKLERILAGDEIINKPKAKEICIFWNEISIEQAGQKSGEGDVSPEGAAQDAAPSEEQEGPEKIAQNGSQNTPNDDWAIERFSHLNAGKIPLTESELIKAYFIDKLASNRVDEFSLQWEEIERGLSDDEFWGFLSSKEYETRIDLLFEIAYPDQNSANKSHALSLKVAEELKGKDAYAVWQEAVQCYQTLRDWYEDYFFYHMIGYIIAVDKKSSAEIIKELYGEYQQKSKTDFKRFLKEYIRSKLELLNPIFGKKTDKKNSKEEPEESEAESGDGQKENSIDLENPDNGLSYNGPNKASIKPILLLFNVALLVNAHQVNSDNATDRFSFKLYKSTENPIEIEHINPKHLEGRDVKIEDKKSWATKVLEIIENAPDQLKNVDEEEWTKPNTPLIEQLEEAAKLNDISNLTLLDKKLNASYKDNFFNEKRKHILAARFGNAIPGTDDEPKAYYKQADEPKAYYKQSVIFPGTMWVFLREYQDDSASQQQPSANGSADFWTSDDRKKYIKTMEDSIYRLLFE